MKGGYEPLAAHKCSAVAGVLPEESCVGLCGSSTLESWGELSEVRGTDVISQHLEGPDQVGQPQYRLLRHQDQNVPEFRRDFM